MALPKSHHLSLRFERERLDKLGKTLYGKFFTLVVADTPEDKKITSPHLAILISKKTATRAVDRNKIKRVTSALLESVLPTIPAKDYLVIPKRQVLTEDYSSLLVDIKTLLTK